MRIKYVDFFWTRKNISLIRDERLNVDSADSRGTFTYFYVILLACILLHVMYLKRQILDRVN